MAVEETLVGHGSAVRGLAERWLPAVVEDARARGGDFACSPAGLWLALAAAAAGAAGETATELRALLGVGGQEAGPAVTGAARELARTEALRVATGVWSRVPVYRAFRESLPDVGFGQLDPERTDEIDAWVREETGGLVERLPVNLTEDSALVLVNALALAARWRVPFEPEATRDELFTDGAGGWHHVPTMHRDVPPHDAWQVPAPGGAGPVSVVQLHCGNEAVDGSWNGDEDEDEGRLGDAGEDGLRALDDRRAPGQPAGPPVPERPAVVRFVLGPLGAGPAQVLPAAWAGPAERTGFDADQVKLALPRLALRTTLTARSHLAALGMVSATSGRADFSLLSPERLAIDEVVQECVVRVAEAGVEAAAATALVFSLVSGYMPKRIVELSFHRPFGVVVLDADGAVPLFTAWQATAPNGPAPAA